MLRFNCDMLVVQNAVGYCHQLICPSICPWSVCRKKSRKKQWR